jgi:hypothetical protein
LRALIVVAIVAAIVVAPWDALGCPRCETGKLARAEVFGPDFGSTLLLLLLPLLVSGGVAALVRFIGRPGPRR